MILKKELIKSHLIHFVAALFLMTLTVFAVVAPIKYIEHQKLVVMVSSPVFEESFVLDSGAWADVENPLFFSDTVVHVECSTVKNDITINLINDTTDNLETGIVFRAILTDSSGKETTYECTEKNGFIYQKNIKAGKYTVSIEPMGGYSLSDDTVEITIKNTSPYKAITKKIVTKPVAKKEIVQHEAVQTVTLVDTVKFVESTKILIPGTTEYVEVTFSDILVPIENDETIALYDKEENPLFIKSEDESFVEASEEDYSETKTFYKQVITEDSYKYTGWQTIDGKRYYFDESGIFVTGIQIISGARYVFNSDGTLSSGSGALGIDISVYQGTINWTKVKASGVSFVIIRVGGRGWGSEGNMYDDKNFDTNIKGAIAAGLDVGIYYFSTAINEKEAIEEASYCVQKAAPYKSQIKLPIFIDVESAGGSAGRTYSLSSSARTAVCKAFCETIKNSGYKAGIYANKSWLETKMYAAQLEQYYIWLAHWGVEKSSYAGKYDFWQYTSTGSVSGISGNVDMNKSYYVY